MRTINVNKLANRSDYNKKPYRFTIEDEQTLSSKQYYAMSNKWLVYAAQLIHPKHGTACRVEVKMSPKGSIQYAVFQSWDRSGACHHGMGKAGGWGYCKRSQAIANAMLNAGLSFKSGMFPGGCGLSEIHNAMAGLAYDLGYRGNMMLVEVGD